MRHNNQLRSYHGLSDDVTALVSILTAAVTAVSIATIVHWKFGGHVRRCHRSKGTLQEDTYYLNRCHNVRLSLSKPRHSGFRVVALLVLETGEMIFGSNDEPAVSIAGALCAERAALLSYRIQYMSGSTPSIVAIYIVSDHPHQAITPGCLCREYMYGHPAIDPIRVRIVLQSANRSSSPVQVSLCDLYPYPSILARDCPNVTTAMQISKFHAQNLIDWNTIPPGTSPILWSHIQRLRRAGLEYLQTQSEEIYTNADIYPIAFVASILIYDDHVDDGDNLASSSVSEPTIVFATQISTLEYGCTQDAVCRVLAKISTNQNPQKKTTGAARNPNTSMVVLQMDSNGVPHAPFAAARSVLTEYYHHSASSFHVVVYDGTQSPSQKTIQVVPVTALAPASPQIVVQRDNHGADTSS
jgi:cytidine deaminase